MSLLGQAPFRGVFLSNKDVQPSGSQAAAEAAFIGEMESAHTNGSREDTQRWAALAATNTGNKLYKNA